MKKRKIMVITGSRGEYGYIRPILNKIKQDKELEYVIVATNMLLIPEFGYAVNNFLNDGFEVKYKIHMSMAGYSNESMVKSLGIFLQSLTDIVANDPPSIILLAGDRGEQIVGAIVGAHVNIPVAHIQAGELSGNIDGMTRHAITKFTHIHFAANEDAATRLLKMGEQEFRVFNVGAPQIDEFKEYTYYSKEIFYPKYNLNSNQPVALIVQHSTTEESNLSESQMQITLDALIELQLQSIIIFPNNDAGSVGIQKVIEKNRYPFFHIRRNVSREEYANLMNCCDLMIGNSSSGLLEAPSFSLPAVNIGRRQIGRYQAHNVINCEHEKIQIKESIKKAMDPEFRKYVKGVKNPYGDGNSSEKIIEILKNIEINAKLLNKMITY